MLGEKAGWPHITIRRYLLLGRLVMTRRDDEPAAGRDRVGAGPAGAAPPSSWPGRGSRHCPRTVLARLAKICGEYLSPEGTRILDAGCLRRSLLPAPDLAGMRITAPDGRVNRGALPRGRPGVRTTTAHCRARALLDGALSDEAAQRPLDLREDVRVTDVIVEGSRRVAGVKASTARGAGTSCALRS